MGQLFSDILDWWLNTVINPALKWVFDLLLWLPRKVFAELLDQLAVVIESMEVPEFLANGGNLWGGIDSGILYFMSVAELGFGVPLVIGAYVARFLLRRIPFIG